MKTRDQIRTLVIDDSAFSRLTITRMLESSPLVRVVDVARDGEEALRKTFELKPDLITLDLEMPRMDGFTFLRLVMNKQPTPVIVISGRNGDQDVFKALDLGAVDFIAKPAARPSPELALIQEELIRKLYAIRELRIEKLRERLAVKPVAAVVHSLASVVAPRVVAIGSSTGGPAALMRIFDAFREPPPCAILVSQHMPRGFTRGFAERIHRLSKLAAHEATDGAPVTPGEVLIAPGGCHLELASKGKTCVARILPRVEQDKYTPSVDRLFISAAKHYGRELLAIVLTGMGDDGREGAAAVKQSGGAVIAESEETAIIFGMPQQAIRSGVVDAVLPLDSIPEAILTGVPRIEARKRRQEETR